MTRVTNGHGSHVDDDGAVPGRPFRVSVPRPERPPSPVARPRPATERRTAGLGPRPPRESLVARLAVVAVALGLVLGAVVGMLVGSLTSGSVRAAALVALTPQDANSGAQVSPDQQRQADEQFAQAELAWLSGESLQQGVTRRLGLSRPADISAERVGQSLTARFSAEAPTEAGAVALVQAAVDVYSERWVEAANARGRAQLAALDRALADTIRLGDVEQSAQLQDLRARATVELAQAAGGATVLAPPAGEIGPSTPRWLLGLVLGALTGALVLVLLLALWRTRTTRLVERADLEGTGRLLHPDAPRDVPAGATSRAAARRRLARRRAARLLVAQLVDRPSVTGRTIVVVGTTRGSDSGRVARLLTGGAAEHAPTILVTLEPSGALRIGEEVATPPDPRAGERPVADTIAAVRDVRARWGHGCLVLDAGSMEDSALPLAALTLASEVVLVARRFHDAVADVEAVGVMFQRATGSPALVLTTGSPAKRATAEVARGRPGPDIAPGRAPASGPERSEPVVAGLP